MRALHDPDDKNLLLPFHREEEIVAETRGSRWEDWFNSFPLKLTKKSLDQGLLLEHHFSNASYSTPPHRRHNFKTWTTRYYTSQQLDCDILQDGTMASP